MQNPLLETPSLIHTLTQSTPSQQRAALYAHFTPTASFTHPFCATSSWSLSPTLNSRWAIWKIYQWYKIMSPHISLEVLSVTFNEEHLKLYVDIHQHFRLWIVPGYDAEVWLTTVLTLAVGDERGPESVGESRMKGQRHGVETSRDKEKGEPGPWSYAAVADPTTSTTNANANANANADSDVMVNGDEDGDAKPFYYITAQDDLYQTSEWIKFLSVLGIAHLLVVAWMFFATGFSVVGSYVLVPITWAMETGRLTTRGRRIKR
ncbi:hypothetical protein LTR70_001457 [Exophiala xenobiotica]|uniref:SigF-like NTF2-like domain-containing protein n=1 Tax=Lithohypha guttulata TaxID=1690604 RepID=A0ABR0KGU7_9EURO|nr:hypothetical protein LTR24_002747 [Lithohypha guttulata]KAK5327834.1 hypothetical protein LTR70_001457 [Exophiala xenobiotica]